MLLSNQLKEIAKTYNIFIMTSTQLNGDSFVAGQKRDQRMIRGSKAIIDKADVGIIATPVDEADLEIVKSYCAQLAYGPTHVMDIYKIRSGRFRGVRLWYYLNLGNGERHDLFITDENNNLMQFEPYEVVEDSMNMCSAIDDIALENFLKEDE